MKLFRLEVLETTFRMDNLTQGWTQLGPFLQNRGTFFNFIKGQGRPPLPPPSPLHFP